MDSKKPWLGTWKLISCEGRSDGKIDSEFGEEPFGRLSYDADGHMYAFISASDRNLISLEDPATATEEEKAACFDKFVSYCGTYEFHEDGKVEHFVAGSFFSKWIGTTLVRYYQIKENILELKTAKVMLNDREWEFFLVWEKISY